MTRFNDLTLSEQGDKRARFDKLAEEIDATAAGDSTIAGKVEALETAVGAATGEHAGGLVKDVADIESAIGAASGDDAGGILKDVADLKAAVGDSETQDTLVYDVADIVTYIGEILTANSLTDPRAGNGDG